MTRIELLQNFVKTVFKIQDIELIPVSGDASFRKYYRIVINGDSYIVMDSPPDKEPPDQFIKVTEYLVASNINVPRIAFKDEPNGILIIKDFGDKSYLDSLNEASADQLYKEAIDTLIEMQKQPIQLDLPNYDRALLVSEMELFENWLLDRMLNIQLSKDEKEQLSILKEVLINNALNQQQVFVHRDYHSRNLMKVSEKNPGIIDYQDAVVGPITYDLVSMLKDCYIKWPIERIEGWCKYYLANNQQEGMGFDKFMQQFHLMGVQRQLKASGIFARLKYRDNKPNYIKDIPRTLSYITDLTHIDELRPLIDLIESKVMKRLEAS